MQQQQQKFFGDWKCVWTHLSYNNIVSLSPTIKKYIKNI
jgi:hypothetical protein